MQLRTRTGRPDADVAAFIYDHLYRRLRRVVVGNFGHECNSALLTGGALSGKPDGRARNGVCLIDPADAGIVSCANAIDIDAVTPGFDTCRVGGVAGLECENRGF